MRPSVKICGITAFEDAALALELGADEIGFVFAPSPRRISPETVASILERLHGAGLLHFAGTVGVFVNEEPGTMARIVESLDLSAAQIHGDESPETCAAFAFPWFRALRIASAEEAEARCAASWACRRILVDAAAAGAYGGTGRRVGSETARAAAEATRRAGKAFFLAGGIGPDNVAEVVRGLAPDGIDISSGVEETPGRKSRQKLERLFAELRRVDREAAP